MWVGAVSETRRWEALARKRFARVAGAFARAPRSTPLGNEADQGIGDIFSTRSSNKLQNPCKNSGRTPVYLLRGRSIRKEIIGHRMLAIVSGFRAGKHVRRPDTAVSLLHQQTRQHGGGVLLHPLVQQGSDFLAQVGGMREPRQLKTLQGVPRSGKKKLPRWLGRAGSHKPPFDGSRRLAEE